MTTATAKKTDVPVEAKLKALYNLQHIQSDVDKIRMVRGELPLEVQDLEDEIEGLETRTNNYAQQVESIETKVADAKNAIKDCKSLIKKYEEQQSKVRNNREFDSLKKEGEFQHLEIQLQTKRIDELTTEIEVKNGMIGESKKVLKERKKDLGAKKEELDGIVAETEKEEKQLIRKSAEAEKVIEDRLLAAYKRIRDNVRNGLAVVPVDRDACGGCFNKIPPQRQLDIRMHKKIIVCEHCGRILVSPVIAGKNEIKEEAETPVAARKKSPKTSRSKSKA